MILRKVKQEEIVKIAVLVSALVTLPITISLFRISALGQDDLPVISFGYLLIRLLFIFLLSYVVLQFNSNWKYQNFRFPPTLQKVLVVLVNIGIYIASITLFTATYTFFVAEEMTGPEKKFFYFIFSIVHILQLFIARILRLGIIRQENLLENERLQQQNLQKELSALKNQLNPHFLFNSLNTLNSLIRENSEATMFVNKLSHMYRYILQSGERDLVCLKDELKFLDSYAFLIKTRYRQACFEIDMDIDEHHYHQEIPPMALQLLVENAVKHNEISKNCPLQLRIYSEGNYIVVRNRLHSRISEVEGTGSGLLNLDKRYMLLRKKKIIIEQDDTFFTVKLPVIPLE